MKEKKIVSINTTKIRNETEQFTTDNAEIQRIRFSSVAQSCPTLCDPMNCSIPGLSVHQQLIREYYELLMEIKWITWKKWAD